MREAPADYSEIGFRKYGLIISSCLFCLLYLSFYRCPYLYHHRQTCLCYRREWPALQGRCRF